MYSCSKDEQSPKTKITEAALRLFAEKGFKDASVQDIANLAGVNKSMLFYYFQTKENLFYVVVKEHFKQLVLQLTNVLSTKDEPLKILSNLLDTLIAIRSSKMKLGLEKIIIEDSHLHSKDIEDYIKNIMSTIFDKTAYIIEQCISRGTFKKIDSKLTAISIFGLLHFFNKLELNDYCKIEDNEMREFFQKLYMEGLKL